MKKNLRKIIISLLIFAIIITSFYFLVRAKFGGINEYIAELDVVYTPQKTATRFYYQLMSIDTFEYWIFKINNDEKQILLEDIEEGNWYDFEKNKLKLQEIIDMGNNEIVIQDLNEKINIMNNLNMDLIDIDKISYYVSHGDFSYLQFIYEEEKVKAIIDFIRVKKLPIVWEIMRSYSYMDKNCKDGKINIDNLILYVKEFMKSVPLNKYDLKYMPYVYMCQLLRSTYGYKEVYKKDNNDILEFAHFRTELCKNIYDNLEEISKKLEELI